TRLGSRCRPHAARRTDRAAAAGLPRLANNEIGMTINVGAAKITRIEETYDLFFEAKQFFADWRDEIVAEHMGWMVPDHYDPKSGYLKLSIHSWLLEVGAK